MKSTIALDLQKSGSSLASAVKNPATASTFTLTPLKLPAARMDTLSGTILGRMASKSGDAIREKWNKKTGASPPKLNPNLPKPPPTLPPTGGNPPPTDKQPIDLDDLSDAKQSAFQPILNVPTNDGTQRITIRWTPAEKGLSPERKPGEWASAVLKMLKDLFQGDVGHVYRWESTDLSRWKTMTEMTEGEIREFLSPTVTYVQSQSMFIFGLRFGFSTKTPVLWQSQPSTKQAMRQHKIWATVSNSSCTSGPLVIAGYVLMKAPNTTHRIRYLQSLRNRLPENTPFFDITLVRRSPVGQPIHHLGIQCGENHVAPLTKAISALLTGSGCAVFLPRVVLGKLTEAQITKYFTAHSDYVKSLRPIGLAPMVTNLDTIREEHYEGGVVLKRTTRDWATSLTLPSTGHSARCDIVNGGSDHIATLLAPKHVYDEVKHEVEKYKLRLNPLSRREARFLDKIPGLPDVIHIDMTVQQSLDCLELLSSEDIWKHAPSAVRGNPPSDTDPSIPPTETRASHAIRPSDSIASHLSDSSDSGYPASKRTARGGKKNSKFKNTASAQSNASTASTHSVMTPSLATQHCIEFDKYDQLLERQQAQLDQGQAESNRRWSSLENQLQVQKEDQNAQFEDLRSKVTKSMGHLTVTNATLYDVQTQLNVMMEMIKAFTHPESRKRTKTRHSSVPVGTAASSLPLPAIQLPLMQTDLPASVSLSTLTQPSRDSQSESIIPTENAPTTSLENTAKKRPATDDDESMEEDSEGEFSHVIDGLSIGDMESIDDSIPTEFPDDNNNPVDNPSVDPVDSQSPALPSPPLDAQYTDQSDPAGGVEG